MASTPTPSPWARRCPMGHSTIQIRTRTNRYGCATCRVYYAGDPVDAREVPGFPRPPEEYTVVDVYGDGDSDQDRHQNRPSPLQVQTPSQSQSEEQEVDD